MTKSSWVQGQTSTLNQTYSLPKTSALVFRFFFFSTSVSGNTLFSSSSGAWQHSPMTPGRSRTAFSHGSMGGRGVPGFTARWCRHWKMGRGGKEDQTKSEQPRTDLHSSDTENLFFFFKSRLMVPGDTAEHQAGLRQRHPSIHTRLQYLEKSLEFRVGDAVDLEEVLWLFVIAFLHQHHGVDEAVHSRQLSFWRSHMDANNRTERTANQPGPRAVKKTLPVGATFLLFWKEGKENCLRSSTKGSWMYIRHYWRGDTCL